MSDIEISVINEIKTKITNYTNGMIEDPSNADWYHEQITQLSAELANRMNQKYRDYCKKTWQQLANIKQIQDITRKSFYFNDETYTITQLIYKKQCKYEILYEGRKMASLSTVEDVARTIHKWRPDCYETFESILSDLQEAFTGAQTMYQPLTIRQIQRKIKEHALAMAQYPDSTDWHRDQIISLKKELANLVKAKAAAKASK